jgi:hypothetical protein
MVPKICYYDIETSPLRGYFFELWKEGNIVKREKEWYMLSWSAKMNGKVITRGLDDYHTEHHALLEALSQTIYQVLKDNNLLK